jgi:hypothetical protein
VHPITAYRYGIQQSGLYEIVVFHAERQTASSTYTLRLTGFNLSKSICAKDG